MRRRPEPSLHFTDPLTHQAIMERGALIDSRESFGGAEAKAQEMAWQGFEALGREEHERAKDLFLAALRIVPDLPDALNGLAEKALREGDPREAEATFARALAAARERLGRDGPDDFDWWHDHKTRPYLRARHGLAEARCVQGDPLGAVLAYRDLLRRNPDDNQGARFLVAPLLLLAGRTAEALDAFREHDEAYPGDRGEPHYELSRALALFLSGRGPEAVEALVRALHANPYIVPTLLGVPREEHRIWHGWNLAEPWYAFDYLRFFEAWRRSPEAWHALARFHAHPAIRDRLERWLGVGRKLARESQIGNGGSMRWVQLIDERRAIEGEPVPPDVVADVVLPANPADPRDETARAVSALRLRNLTAIRDLDRRGFALEDINRKALDNLAKLDAQLWLIFEMLFQEADREESVETLRCLVRHAPTLAEPLAAALDQPGRPVSSVDWGVPPRKRRKPW